MRRALSITALVLAAATPALASSVEDEQRKVLMACQDRLFGVPPVGAETHMETTYNKNHPIVRVIAGGVVNEWQARDINSCAARTWGFQGPITLADGAYGTSCPPGFRGMYRGTLLCR
ncbi:hypothetical protein [uncultured Pelagimonas sp.]|uniref:hypothetical protein n=1 Tax=uncultured Pelagimonas sp. TaxID=1618102 RepID=UPI0026049531|nr:hypothetical protein [uncultured Pelagimonas sp.]